MLYSQTSSQDPVSGASGGGGLLPDVTSGTSAASGGGSQQAAAAAAPPAPHHQSASNVSGLPVSVTEWMETRGKRAALKLEKLDTDLKNYRSNSIKESIRRGHDDLGDHYLDCGDLSNALKCYSR